MKEPSYHYQTKTIHQLRAVYLFCKEIGYDLNGVCDTFEDEVKTSFEKWPIVTITPSSRSLGGTKTLGDVSRSSIYVESLAEFLDYAAADKPPTVVINDEYTATIDKDSITVGCQTIPWSKVLEIVAAHDALK